MIKECPSGNMSLLSLNFQAGNEASQGKKHINADFPQ
jgi:hypothetical protein